MCPGTHAESMCFPNTACSFADPFPVAGIEVLGWLLGLPRTGFVGQRHVHTPFTCSAVHPNDETIHLEKQNELAEFQGLYGSYHVAEILLQKIWMRREFTIEGARTHAGKPVEILYPGNWNRLSGPDFLGAHLRIDGEEVRGDVEIHFRAESWIQHGHDRDPAFDNVVLHVVLFPPSAHAAPTVTRSGKQVPVLALVDLLWHDLEEYATDDAVAALSGRDPWPALERLLAMAPDRRQAALQSAASRRWKEKCHFASLRVRRLGWSEACHQTTLEILGYRANRTAMLKVAHQFPLGSWNKIAPDSDALMAAADGDWTMRGVRPANQPRIRLEQYSRWVKDAGDWPSRLLHLKLPRLSESALAEGVTRMRRTTKMSALRERLKVELCQNAIGGTRLDTWIVNLALPFLASTDHAEAATVLWMAWYPGDVPDTLRQAVRQLTNDRRQPVSNGILQAVVELQLERWRADGPQNNFARPAPVGKD